MVAACRDDLGAEIHNRKCSRLILNSRFAAFLSGHLEATALIEERQTATWDKNEMTLPNNGIGDLSQEWWYGKWLAGHNVEYENQRGTEQDDEWPFGHLVGKFSLRSYYRGEEWGEW